MPAAIHLDVSESLFIDGGVRSDARSMIALRVIDSELCAPAYHRCRCKPRRIRSSVLGKARPYAPALVARRSLRGRVEHRRTRVEMRSEHACATKMPSHGSRARQPSHRDRGVPRRDSRRVRHIADRHGRLARASSRRRFTPRWATARGRCTWPCSVKWRSCSASRTFSLRTFVDPLARVSRLVTANPGAPEAIATPRTQRARARRFPLGARTA